MSDRERKGNFKSSMKPLWYPFLNAALQVIEKKLNLNSYRESVGQFIPV